MEGLVVAEGAIARPLATNGHRPGHRLQVSVVLPCFNEAEAVARCVQQAVCAIAEAGYAGEVVVVDNGSSDRSAALAAAAGARVVKEDRRGYGCALRAGIAAAQGDIVVMADADGTYELTRLSALVAPIISSEADIVVGSRLDDATRRSMPLLHRYVGTPMLSLLLSQIASGRCISDSQSGFRAFRKADAQRLGLRSTGMEFASEMLIRASRCGLRLAEVPTRYGERIGSSKLRTFPDGWRHLRLICLLAPQLLLTLAGAVLFFGGFLVSIASLVWPSGVAIGSTRWQPIFFGGIVACLGVQAFVTGLVLAELGVRHSSGQPGLAFMAARSFQRRCMTCGVVVVLVGLLLDAFLFVRWLTGVPLDRGLALAGLAQTLIVCGTSVACFALIARAVTRFGHPAAELDADAERASEIVLSGAHHVDVTSDIPGGGVSLQPQI